MTTLIIITAYILSVFLARWINKKLYHLDNYNFIVSWLWFLPVFNVLFLTILYIIESRDMRSNWFNGKNW